MNPGRAASPPHQVQDPAMRSLWASSCQLLQQPSPPTLREILGAYTTKGDGDRDMLLAMLNAKSAEDQRLAALASLHRSMLDVHSGPLIPHLPQLYMPDTDHHPRYTNGPQLPPHPQPYPPSAPYAHVHPYKLSPRSPSPTLRQDPLEHIPRKRPRTTHSHSFSHSQSHRRSPSPHEQQPPPSPYASSSTSTSRHSPHARGAMAIGALLSSANPDQRDATDDRDSIRTRRSSSSEHSDSAHRSHESRHHSGSVPTAAPEPMAV